MKKNTLVQLVVIYLGLSSVYVAINAILSGLYFILFTEPASFSYSFTHFHDIIPYLLILAAGVAIILKSGSIGVFISEKAGLDDSLTIFSTPRQLLSILLVVTAIAHLLQYLPNIVQDALHIFINRMPRRLDQIVQNDTDSTWVLDSLHIVFPCLVIIFARNLTDYFAKNIIQDDEEMVAHQDTIEIGNEDDTGNEV